MRPAIIIIDREVRNGQIGITRAYRITKHFTLTLYIEPETDIDRG